MRSKLPSILGLVCALFILAQPSHSQNALSCPSATDGAAFGSAWLPCTPAATRAGPAVPAATPLAVQRCVGTTCSNLWVAAGNLQTADRVWGHATAAATTDTYFAPAGVLQIGTVTPPATGNGVLTATWTASTKNTDGSSITLPLTYTLFWGASGAESSNKAALTALTQQLTGLPTDKPTCAYVIAVTTSGASVPSLEACQIALAPAAVVPAAPAKVTLTTTQVQTPQ
jgi:hypothetical protein